MFRQWIVFVKQEKGCNLPVAARPQKRALVLPVPLNTAAFSKMLLDKAFRALLLLYSSFGEFLESALGEFLPPGRVLVAERIQTAGPFWKAESFDLFLL